MGKPLPTPPQPGWWRRRGILRWGQRAVPERPVIVVELFAGSGEAAKLRAQDPTAFSRRRRGEANGISHMGLVKLWEIIGKLIGFIIGKLTVCYRTWP